jgi:hypothetical protein
MTIKRRPAGTRSNHTRFDGGKPELTEVGFEFGFSPILKYGFGSGNGDIDTYPEPVLESAPLILKLNFTFFKLETLKESLKLH